MCLSPFTRCSRIPETGRGNRSSPYDERKQPLLPKPALVNSKSQPLNKRPKKVAFMPTLQDVHDSLSRKEARLSSLSDHPTAGTVDSDFETTSSCLSSISLVIEAGGSVCGLSVNDVSFAQSVKHTSTSHMRNVSNTAVFGDETTTSSAKEPHLLTVSKPGPYTDSSLPYPVSALDLATTAHTPSSPGLLISDLPMPSGSVDSDQLDHSHQADEVFDASATVGITPKLKCDDSACVPSIALASSQKAQTAGDFNKKDVKKTWPTQQPALTTGPPSRTEAVRFTPRSAETSAEAVRVDQRGQQHNCCVGVLSAFEAKFLNDEDKQAILEGGCHGLCTVQTTFPNGKTPDDEGTRHGSLKSLPPARDPSDRLARFISPMPSDIMPNGRRGEKSTLPRFPRRRVAAGYKRPRTPLALVEHPSRRTGRPRGILLARPNSLEQTEHTSLRNAVRDSKPSTLANYRSNHLPLSSLDYWSWITHQPKQNLKRQVKHDDLRQRFESQGELVKEARMTVQAKEARVTVEAKEKSLSSRKLFRRLRTLF